jgi:hypothetical protein
MVEVMTAGNDALTALQAKAPSIEEVDKVMASLDDNVIDDNRHLNHSLRFLPFTATSFCRLTQ